MFYILRNSEVKKLKTISGPAESTNLIFLLKNVV
jgi:hypothetical protein